MSTAASADGPSAWLTYEPYYGLREKPFSLSSDPRFLYTGPSHVQAFEQLLAGIRRREGLIVLSGEIGTGKTTLCRGVLGALDRRTFTTFVRDPFLSREDLLKTLLIDFGVMSIDDLKGGRLTGATRPDLSYPLYEFLDSLVPLQAFAVLIIDEAQNLSLSLLEEIRILSELEAREKLLQVVLVGQPELRANLKLPQLRQVDQRVSVRCELAPLPADEVALYIAHRLGVASVGEPAVAFTAEAARLVWRASGGVPRVINLVCDRALHRGFTARANAIDAAIVFAAVEDMGREIAPDAAPPAAVPAPAMPAPPAAPVVERAAAAVVAAPGAHPIATVPAATVEGAPGVPGSSQPGASCVAATSPLVQTGLADPLAEFGHEADLLRADRRWWRLAAAAVVTIALAVGGGFWFAQRRLASEVASTAGDSLPPAPAFDPDPQAREDAIAPVGEGVESASIAGASDTDRAAYGIQVASFQSRGRAQRLLDELRASGYRAEEVEVDLGPRGRWRQVMVGRYATAGEAEADLARIRDLPPYADARIVPLSAE